MPGAPFAPGSWIIEIFGPDGSAKRWDAYRDRAHAESVCATLRHHGFDARVWHDAPAAPNSSAREAKAL